MPVPKKIYLHIGAHKTGTSSIQHFFADNRAELARRGYLYPQSCNHLAGHHRLAFALRGLEHHPDLGKLDFAGEVRALKLEIAASECQTVIISSEEFFGLEAAKIVILRNALADYELRILAVLRRPDHLFESLYNQRIKALANGFTRHYTEFLTEPLRLSLDLRFVRALNNWHGSFGKDALALLCYEHSLDAVNLLSSAICLPIEGLKPDPERRNESVSVRAAALIRQGKLLGLDEATLNRLKQIGRISFPKAAETGSLLSPDERMTLLMKTDAMTDKVFARYYKSENEYHSRRFSKADFPEMAELTLADAIRIIAELL